MGAYDHEAEVAIIGGGPVGMGLAVELGRRGISCIVIERYPEPQRVPKGQNLTQRTMEHFHVWGIEKALRAARTIPPEYGIGGLTAYGTLLSDYHYDWLQRELVRPYYFTDNERLPQYATEAVLRARVRELADVEVLYGWSAADMAQDGQGCTLTIHRKEDGEARRVRALHAVGCDGARSLVRERAGITQTRSDHDRRMVLLVFRSGELHELLKRYPGKSFYNVLHPELEGYWMFLGRVDLGSTWFFHAPVPADATRDTFDFRGYLHRAVGAEFAIDFEHIGFWDLRFALADQYRKGRIFIAGDAAHSHPPYGGYGINTGFEDARNLGWKLAAALRGWGGAALLASYDSERRPVFASTARDFIAASIENDRRFLARFAPDRDRAAFEREWAARGSGARSEVSSFQPNYRGSPIVWGTDDGACDAVSAHSFTARAGYHLAPQAMSTGENVYEVLGDDFTLLAFGADDEDVAAFETGASRLEMPLQVVRDSFGDERRHYGARLVLVRPDHFVAWAGDSLPAQTGAETVLARVIGRG